MKVPGHILMKIDIEEACQLQVLMQFISLKILLTLPSCSKQYHSKHAVEVIGLYYA